MSKVKTFWGKNDQRILTVLAIILTAVVSFQAGRFQQEEVKAPEIKISLNQGVSSNPADEKIKILGETSERKGVSPQAVAPSDEKTEVASGDSNVECVLVGSKNSDKYHLPDCSYAARIKPENRVCFSSVEDAESKGYKPAGCCHKN